MTVDETSNRGINMKRFKTTIFLFPFFFIRVYIIFDIFPIVLCYIFYFFYYFFIAND